MGYYLTEHGLETLTNLRKNLEKTFTKEFPVTANILGIGKVVFTSRDQLAGYIQLINQILLVEEDKK